MAQGAENIVLLIILCVAAIVVAAILYRLYKKRSDAAYLGALFGQPPDRLYGGEELDKIKEAAQFVEGGQFAVDDITWNDLGMDDVYARINASCTSAGDQALYAALRNPERRAYEKNLDTIHWLEQNPDKRLDAAVLLYRCGRLAGVDLRLLLSDSPYKCWVQVLGIALCAGLIALIVLGALGVSWTLVAVFPLVVLNIIISTVMHSRHARFINTISYVTSITVCARRLRKKGIGLPGMEEARFDMLLRELDGIRKNAVLSFFYTDDAIIMLLGRIFLLEPISFLSVVREMKKKSGQVIELYRHIGRLDAMIAAASWRKSVTQYCEPVFVDGRGPFIKMQDAVHPLLGEPVPNSIDIAQNLLVTGSNATGKSTFLKMVAVNAILGQTIGTCLAKKWEGSFFSVFTSMALRDDIIAHESYFITELKSLKRMMDYDDPHKPALFIVDEVLRGTNTAERIAASSEALFFLARKNCLCIAATHDLELSFLLEGPYRNVHFTEQVLDGDMQFDYELKEGRSQSRNAIALLGLLGYDAQLVQGAARRFDRFGQTGTWEKT